MKLYRGLHNITTPKNGCVATIGNFDGVHLGHQQVIKRLIEKSKQMQLPAYLITFEPMPSEYFATSSPARLTTLREKLLLLTQLQVDVVVCIKFTKEFAHISAEQFVKEILVNKLRVKHLIVGDDFRFGHQRQGDFRLLTTLAPQLDMQVEATISYQQSGQRVSSTIIRNHLKNSNFYKVTHALGRNYQMLGRVIHGENLGHELGFPTANLALNRKISPLQGIFIVKVYLDNKILAGVASLGTRPTIGGQRELLEIHIFDFAAKIYGKFLRVEFLQKLRNEEKYPTLDAMVEQIKLDVAQAKDFFNSNTH